MKKNLLLVALCAASLSACVHQSGPGVYISSNTESHKGLVTHAKTCDGDVVVASPDGQVGTMAGRAIKHSILGGLVQWGSDSAGLAAQKAAPEFRYRNSPNEGIREVDTVGKGGVKVLWGLIYASEYTVVTGEAEPSAPVYSK